MPCEIEQIFRAARSKNGAVDRSKIERVFKSATAKTSKFSCFTVRKSNSFSVLLDQKGALPRKPQQRNAGKKWKNNCAKQLRLLGRLKRPGGRQPEQLKPPADAPLRGLSTREGGASFAAPPCPCATPSTLPVGWAEKQNQTRFRVWFRKVLNYFFLRCAVAFAFAFLSNSFYLA